jgi:hypothetical protein
MFPMVSLARYLVCTLLILGLWGSMYPVEVLAQSKQDKKAQKAEKKKWKQKAKGYKKEPLALKRLFESHDAEIQALKAKYNELQQKYTKLQADLDRCENALRRRNYSFDSLMQAYKLLETRYQECQDRLAKADNPDPYIDRPGDKGLYYRVQIGAYLKINMDRHTESTKNQNFSGETLDGLNKFLIGKFKSYDLAKAFRDDIKRIGIRDAFVVAYQDGIRIDVGQAKKIQGIRGE